MRQYLSFFRIRFTGGLQYRAAAWAGVATQFAWGFMTILLYEAFYRSSPDGFPMEFNALVSYIWLQQALLAMFMPWFFDPETFDSIVSGNVAYELCRPCDLYGMWFVKNAAARLANTVLRCFPIIAVAIFLPAPFNIGAPANALCAVLFPISVLLGFAVMVAISMLVYISAFYTLSAGGIKVLAVSVIEFLSGAVIPIPFFPDTVQTVLNLLPFASMQSAPFLIYVGYVTGKEAALTIAVQAFWLIVTLIGGRAWLKRALKRVVVQGG